MVVYRRRELQSEAYIDPLKIKEVGHFGNKSSVHYFSGWGASFIVNEKKVTKWFVDQIETDVACNITLPATVLNKRI